MCSVARRNRLGDPVSGVNWRLRERLMNAGKVTVSRKDVSPSHDGTGTRGAAASEIDFEQVRTAIAGIRYGEVRVIIHDGAIVQIERVEKQRLR